MTCRQYVEAPSPPLVFALPSPPFSPSRRTLNLKHRHSYSAINSPHVEPVQSSLPQSWTSSTWECGHPVKASCPGPDEEPIAWRFSPAKWRFDRQDMQVPLRGPSRTWQVAERLQITTPADTEYHLVYVPKQAMETTLGRHNTSVARVLIPDDPDALLHASQNIPTNTRESPRGHGYARQRAAGARAGPHPRTQTKDSINPRLDKVKTSNYRSLCYM